jgi:hypothetical protein
MPDSSDDVASGCIPGGDQKGKAMKTRQLRIGFATTIAMLIVIASMSSERATAQWLQPVAGQAVAPGCTADRPLRCPDSGQCATSCRTPRDDPKMQVNAQGCPLERPLRCPDTGQCAMSCKPIRDDPKMQVNAQGCPLDRPLRCPDTDHCAMSCKPVRDDPKMQVNAQGCPLDRPLRCPDTGQCAAVCRALPAARK